MHQTPEQGHAARGERTFSFGVVVFHDYELGCCNNRCVPSPHHRRHHVAACALRRHLAQLAVDPRHAREGEIGVVVAQQVVGARIFSRVVPVAQMPETLRAVGVRRHDRRHHAGPAREIPYQRIEDIGDEELAVKSRLAQGRGKGRPQWGKLPIKLDVAVKMQDGHDADRRSGPPGMKPPRAALRRKRLMVPLGGPGPRTGAIRKGQHATEPLDCRPRRGRARLHQACSRT